MKGVKPWVPVEPNTNPQAILGDLPTKVGSVSYGIPISVVPEGATGILVFAWFASTGVNEGLAYWHMIVNLGDGNSNWFPLLVYGNPSQQNAVSYNSQVFWLPMPIDRQLTVRLFDHDVPDGDNQGTVEIHGYMPGGPESTE